MTWMYYRLPQPGALRLQGKDSVAFLQANTTNDLRALRPDQAVITILTNAAGRLMDVLVVLAEPEGLLVLTLPGRAESTLTELQNRLKGKSEHSVPLAALQKRQGQQADVTITDESRLWEQAMLLPGDGAPPGGLDTPTQPGRAQRFPNRSAAISLPKALGGGLLLLNPRGATVMMITSARFLDKPTYETERIRRGILGPETELTAEFSPFEVGLGALVALDKDHDFPGRTLLAYEAKHPERGRTIVGLQLATAVTQPAPLAYDGTQVGHLTSVPPQPVPPIALGTVNRSYAKPGTTLQVMVHRGVQQFAIPAVVTQPPLAQPPQNDD